jgi:NhaP-type Na+/H+ or K+/H+ antiporter
MYQNAAILAGIVLIYSVVAGRIERLWISGPIVFTAAGLLLGPHGLNLLTLQVEAGGLRILAEVTLAMVLFTDAANANLRVVRRTIAIPERLLLVGLPLTIVLGFLFAAIVFPALAVLEAALLAAMLAPTDAALGKPVVTNPAVPAPLREGLNLESGLNDGICVPVIVILLGLAVGTQVEGHTSAYAIKVVVEEIGIGLAAGLALTVFAVGMLWLADQYGWLAEHWVEIPVVALAAISFFAAQALGGSGFIACFVGGLLLGAMRKTRKHDFVRGAESTGEILALLTWVVFGAVVGGQIIGRITWPILLYAVLSLTVIRMLPVFICLAGSGISTTGKLFIGWFGPRGLASIVFGIIVINERLPGTEILSATVGSTILLSVIAHGVTANPLARRLSGRPSNGSGGPPLVDQGPARRQDGKSP